ncbi:hypothetical protein FDK38_003617 [Candidozyma auris]|nr:hypothetical protein FDK38_003617 [[Candida] auris]
MRSIVLAYILQFSQAFAANNLSAMGMNWMHSVTPMETEVYQGTMSKVKSNDESIGVVHKLGSMDEFYNASILDLLQDTTNSFTFEKSRDAVYYDRRMRKWYLQTFSSEKPPVKDILVPITWCYDMTAGKGGSIKQSFEVSLSAQQTFGQQVGLENFLQLDGVILSGSFGVSLSEGITYKDAVSCSVSTGQYARIYMKVSYMTIPRGRRTAIILNDKAEIVQMGDWETTPSYKRFLLKLPVMECALGKDPKICDKAIF